jgi:hypothetical protein
MVRLQETLWQKKFVELVKRILIRDRVEPDQPGRGAPTVVQPVATSIDLLFKDIQIYRCGQIGTSGAK